MKTRIFDVFQFPSVDIRFKNIAFGNFERSLAESHVDITLFQHGNFPVTILFKCFYIFWAML